MFRSILVPTDESPEAAAALPLARDIAQASGGSIHILTAVPDGTSTQTQIARAFIQPAVDYLETLGIRAHANVYQGEPASAILSFARSSHVDLIVMATRGIGNRSIRALTSVAHQVLSESPCPVLLLRAGAHRPDTLRTLLVPVDGSPGGSLAVGAARALSDAAGGRLVLLNVVVPMPPEAVTELPRMTLGDYIDPAWEELARTTSRAYVEGIARLLVEAGVDCEARVATGQVGAEILRCAEEVGADLIVMSTHSVPWPARATVSSVADHVLREGTRPVMLVRREPPVGEVAAGARGTLQFRRY